jgi:hypothetical protein
MYQNLSDSYVKNLIFSKFVMIWESFVFWIMMIYFSTLKFLDFYILRFFTKVMNSICFNVQSNWIKINDDDAMIN